MGDLLGSPRVAPLFFAASTVYILRNFLRQSIRTQRIQHGGVVLFSSGIKRSVCRSGGSCRRRPICIKSYSFLNGNGPMSKTRRYATTRGAFRPNSNVWAFKLAFFCACGYLWFLLLLNLRNTECHSVRGTTSLFIRNLYLCVFLYGFSFPPSEFDIRS